MIQPRLHLSLVLLLLFTCTGCQSDRPLGPTSVGFRVSSDDTVPAVQVSHSEQSESDATNDDNTTVSAEAYSPEVLVQEPKLRAARKPEFSGSFRHSKNRSNFFMLQAFNEAIGSAYHCTVQLLHDGEQCALGTIVDSDGWIVTKASELAGQSSVKCLLSDQRELTANLVGTDVDMDVALMRIPASGLTSVQWDFSVPEQGRWLATTDTLSSVPTAIGVVSAGPMRIPNQKAVLGVLLENQGDRRGALVKQVLMGSGAHDAGLREDDNIMEVDGKKIESRDHLLTMLNNGKGGQYLKLMVNRQDDTLEKRVRLMDLSSEMLDETEMEVNGPISARSTGFGRVFMHDSVLLPNQCGGPLVNLNGKAVGINIARAGRVSTYALPADTLNPIVKRLMQQAKMVSKQSVPSRVVSTDGSTVTGGN